MTKYNINELIIGRMYYSSIYKTSCFIYEGRDGNHYKFTHIFSDGLFKQNSNGFYYFSVPDWYLDGFKYGR